MKKNFPCFSGLVAAFLIGACSPVSPPVKGAESRKAISEWEERAWSGLEESDSLVGIGIPVVVFRNPGAGFSKAEWRKSSGGAYDMYQGFEEASGDHTKIKLQVIGSPGAGPELTEAPSVFSPAPSGTSGEEPREWMSVYAPSLKKQIRYYFVDAAFGDTNDQWATEIFTLTSGDGNTSSYRAFIESTDEKRVPKLFSKLGMK